MKTAVVMVVLSYGIAGALPAQAQLRSEFTYQGRLKETGQPKNGLIDLRFDAFDVGTGGTRINALPTILDAVPVTDGEFTVAVDLGLGVFSGRRVFLEIGVREDPLGDATNPNGFTTLTPRQESTPTPYAQRALSVAASSVQGAEIADGSISAADVDTTSTTTGLQRRLTTDCTPGQAMIGASSNGVPTCRSTVSGIVTPFSSGLSTTRDNATGVVTLSISSSSTQFQIEGRCMKDKAAVSGINPDGSVECIYLVPVGGTHVSVLDTDGVVGTHLSVARNDNFPAVAYYDATNSRLKYLRCSHQTCPPIIQPVVIDDPSNDVGQFVSLTRVGGRPAMAYYDASGDDLKLALCSNTECSASNIIRTVDSGGDVGRFAEIMDVNGRVGIAYHDSSNNGYKFALCNDADCTAPTITPLTGLTGGGTLISDIAATRDDRLSLPRFALISQGSAVLMVNCSTANCSTFTTQTISSDADVAPPLTMTSITLNSVERHWVSWAKPGAARDDLVLCTVPDCSTKAGVTRSVHNLVPSHQAFARTSQGLPVLFRTDTGNRVRGYDFDTTSFADTFFLSATGGSGGAIDATDLSVFGMGAVLHDTTSGELRFYRCERENCSGE